jgi:hypothetical protein
VYGDEETGDNLIRIYKKIVNLMITGGV